MSALDTISLVFLVILMTIVPGVILGWYDYKERKAAERTARFERALSD